MRIKLLKYHPDAVIPFKKHDSDFCYDLVAVSEEEVAPNVWKYGLGWGMQIERGMETITKLLYPYNAFPDFSLDFNRFPLNLSIDIRPRSSIYKTGMVLCNSQGTVDEEYTNEISVIFYHVNKDMPRYKIGERVAQMKIGFTLPCTFSEVDELDETDRGLGGFGSTGR